MLIYVESKIPLAAEQINTNQNGDHSLCRRGCSMDNSIRNPKSEIALNRPVVDSIPFFLFSVRLTSCLHRQLSPSIQAKSIQAKCDKRIYTIVMFPAVGL